MPSKPDPSPAADTEAELPGGRRPRRRGRPAAEFTFLGPPPGTAPPGTAPPGTAAPDISAGPTAGTTTARPRKPRADRSAGTPGAGARGNTGGPSAGAADGRRAGTATEFAPGSAAEDLGGRSAGSASGPKQDRSRATRLRLLETTIQCLARHGWEVSTVGFIAAEAGISRGAVQHHYRTREDLILGALEHMFASRVAVLDALPEPPGSGPGRVHAVVADLVEAVGGELFRAALQVWTVAAADPELRAAVVPLEKHFAREVHRRAVRLLRADDRNPETRGLIQATLDLARGLALADVLTDDSRRRARVVHAWSAQLATALG